MANPVADRQDAAMGDHQDTVPEDFGPRLRALRRSRGSTLAELAAETGLTASTLSRLENGLRRPTVEQLLPLARVHGVALDDLVGVRRTGDPRVHLRPVTRDGMTFVPLSGRAGGLQAFKVVYPPASRWGEPALKTHEGLTPLLEVYDSASTSGPEVRTAPADHLGTPYWYTPGLGVGSVKPSVAGDFTTPALRAGRWTSG